MDTFELIGLDEYGELTRFSVMAFNEFDAITKGFDYGFSGVELSKPEKRVNLDTIEELNFYYNNNSE